MELFFYAGSSHKVLMKYTVVCAIKIKKWGKTL